MADEPNGTSKPRDREPEPGVTRIMPAVGNSSTLPPGTVLNNTHRIVAFIGRGGMGEVYRAHNDATDQETAIKIIRPEHANDPKIAELFRREAEALRKVRNDAVVDYEGLFRDENGRLYLAMEYVDGPSLSEFIRRRPLSPAEVRQLRDRLAQGLAAAHDRGVFHRDLSADNIILPDQRLDAAKIIDFGIAKFADTSRGTVLGGDFAGKYSAVSPEQLGLFGGKVDGRSDIYSLGLVLAAAAIGRPLDMGMSPIAVMEARRSVPDLGDLPAELRAELQEMLQPDPKDRPQSMRDLISPERRVEPGASRWDGAGGKSGGTEMHGGLGSRRVAIWIALVLLVGAGAAGLIYAVKPEWFSAVQERTADQGATPPPVPGSPTTSGPSRVEQPRAPVQPPAPADAGAVQSTVDRVLASFACAGLNATLSRTSPGGFTVTVAGHVGTEGDSRRIDTELAKLDHVQRVFNQAKVEAWPFCEALGVLQSHLAPDAADAPLIRIDRPGQAYREGDPLVVQVTASAKFDGYLYVDYLDAEGNLIHLLPIPVRRDNRVEAGNEVVLGTPSAEDADLGARYYEIQPPFGRNMLIAISSPRPLFDGLRPEQEAAGPYLNDLGTRLAAQSAEEVSQRPFAAYDFFTTAPRE